MKKNIIITALLAFICLSAATISTQTVKPAIPVVVRHKLFDLPDYANDYISQCVKDGYIIKLVAVDGDETHGSQHWLVIAEKY
jgi:hypothetical protein